MTHRKKMLSRNRTLDPVCVKMDRYDNRDLAMDDRNASPRHVEDISRAMSFDGGVLRWFFHPPLPLGPQTRRNCC